MKTEQLDQDTGLVLPDWPAPATVTALCTTRISFQPKASLAERLSGYEAFNLALHVGDDADKVAQNRQALADYLKLSDTRIAWLEQVHGTRMVSASAACQAFPPEQADASHSSDAGIACAIMTADCLPVLFCNLPETDEAQQVAAAHAGWRGLAAGILSQCLAQFPIPEKVIAWLGPAIGQKHFEVGHEVYTAFVQKNPANARAFIPVKQESSNKDPKWLACLASLARIELEAAGIQAVYGGQWCTAEKPELFYSYRRDGARSGRMASLIMVK